MKIAVASDHRGFKLKAQISALAASAGHEVIDLGPDQEVESVDYPDYAALVAQQVSTGAADRGILVCGTGMGMCIAANKFRNVRAITCHDDVTAEMSRRHNDANVMCLSAHLISEKLLSRILELWLRTEFEGGRHARRLDKIAEIEKSECCRGS